MKFLFHILFLVIILPQFGNAQSDSIARQELLDKMYPPDPPRDYSTNEPCTNGVIYAGVSGEAIMFLKLEPFLYYHDWGQALINGGMGWAPGDTEGGIKPFYTINVGIGHTFGYKWVFFNIGLEPALNYDTYISYIDINGVLALRYQISNPNRKFRFMEFGYRPKVFRTHNNGLNGTFMFSIGLTL